MKKIQIVVEEQGWIISALANQWFELFKKKYANYSIELVFGNPVLGADIYIHFIYLNAKPVYGARNIVYVTHVDYSVKGLFLAKLAMDGVEFISMSHQTKELIQRFVHGAIVHCITPRSIQFANSHLPLFKKITFGLFFRIYPDKRKNNDLIVSFLKIVQENIAFCNLVIYGNGFTPLLDGCNRENIFYDDSEFSSDSYRSYLTRCDYVIYFGTDEGAISILDASTLGIPVLATKQGYHIDICLPNGSMLFERGEDILSAVLNLLESMNHAHCNFDPASIIESEHQPLKCYLSCLFDAFTIPFKNNPFRAKDDHKVLMRFIVRTIIKFFSKSKHRKNRINSKREYA
jgi:glycosyltransferase involved in cell wall biosynthesis